MSLQVINTTFTTLKAIEQSHVEVENKAAKPNLIKSRAGRLILIAVETSERFFT